MQDDKEVLKNYINSQRLMSISVVDNGQPWSAIVFFVMDESWKFYFLSSLDTIHCRAIDKGENTVSLSIYDSSQKVSDQKMGVQVQGVAKKVNVLKSLNLALKMWNKLNPGLEDVITMENIKTNKISSRFYEVSPKLIKLFSEKLYGEDESKIFNF